MHKWAVEITMDKVEAKVVEADKEEEAGVEGISTSGHIPLMIGEIYRQKIRKG